jgi:outer membrane protein TolC
MCSAQRSILMIKPVSLGSGVSNLGHLQSTLARPEPQPRLLSKDISMPGGAAQLAAPPQNPAQALPATQDSLPRSSFNFSLADLIERYKKNSPQNFARSGELEVEAARQARISAQNQRLTWGAQINVTGTFSNSATPSASLSAQAGSQVNYAILNRGIDAQAQRAQIELKKAEISGSVSAHEGYRQLGFAYIALVQSQARVSAQQNALSYAEKTVSNLNNLYESGYVEQTQLDAAQGLLAQRKQELATARADFEGSKAKIYALIGQPGASDPPLGAPTVARQPGRLPMPTVADTASHPEIRQAQLDIELAGADVALAKSARQLQVTASGGISAAQPLSGTAEQNSPDVRATIGFAATVPQHSVRGTAAAIESKQALLEKKKNDLQLTAGRIASEANASLATLRSFEGRVQGAQERQQELERVRTNTANFFDKSVGATLRDVIDTQNDAVDAEKNRIDEMANYAKARLNFALSTQGVVTPRDLRDMEMILRGGTSDIQAQRDAVTADSTS